jgi:hypothetical protein
MVAPDYQNSFSTIILILFAKFCQNLSIVLLKTYPLFCLALLLVRFKMTS